jgi:hypothetical protein
LAACQTPVALVLASDSLGYSVPATPPDLPFTPTSPFSGSRSSPSSVIVGFVGNTLGDPLRRVGMQAIDCILRTGWTRDSAAARAGRRRPDDES